MYSETQLSDLARQVRYWILTSTTEAGSGHPTTSLSATDLMTALFFRYLKYDHEKPADPNNDRVLFSKGHAAPLLYSLYATAGIIKREEILKLRHFDSTLEGHPTPRFAHAEVATGSLGQGLSVGVGMALNGKYLDQLPFRTFVLLGDGEMTEGSVWEAVQLAAYYKLDNLIAIVDVNRLGQSQETMYGHDAEAYAQRLRAFNWDVSVIDGHSLPEIIKAYESALRGTGRPQAIVARTFKGKGISFLEDQHGWHGKALPKPELEKALKELGDIDLSFTGQIEKPERKSPATLVSQKAARPPYRKGDQVSTRQAYGQALARLIDEYPQVVSLDCDVKNSTFAEYVLKKSPRNFFEMFIAEQNMVGVAVGLSKRGKVPFASTFACFLTRAYDQIRMAAVSQANIRCVGSHAGVSIGEDGPSQMGLEDLAMFRSVCGSTVLYPSDAVATEFLVEEMITREGIVYLRTNRPATPILYEVGERFPIGGSKTLKSSSSDKVTVVGAGVTVNEALKAHEILSKEGISIRVIDCYSVKPIDEEGLRKAAKETRAVLVVEDHWFEGGLGDAVLNVFAEKPTVPVIKLAIRQMPRSGKPAELLDAYGISAAHIVRKVKELI